jgi:protein-disulfide isomerase-like protein with CxxC motif
MGYVYAMNFCTAVNCIDGRVQLPVIHFLQERFCVDCVDVVSEPGVNRILAEGIETNTVHSVMERVAVSVDDHESVGLAVVGHHDCTANPAPEAVQTLQTRSAVERLQISFPDVPVVGLWVDADWEVSELS